MLFVGFVSRLFLRGWPLPLVAAAFFGWPGVMPALGGQRVANTTLRLPSNPGLSEYRTTPLFPGIKWFDPVGVATPAGETNRVFVIEKYGQITVITNLASPNRSVFLDLTPRKITASGESGVLGLAFHPGYATNGYFFVFYSLANHTNGALVGRHQRISRFQTVPPQANQASLETERPLITQFDEASNHNGGDLQFGPDGYLYASLGDEGGANDQYANGQRIDRDFFSGILRLDVDQRPGNPNPNPHPAIGGPDALPYRIPHDNPWVTTTSFNGRPVQPQKVRTEFWAVGLRNPWRISFDPATGRLYCGDVGQGGREEVDVVVGGGNYGWPAREGSVAGPHPETAPAGTVFVPPILEYRHGTGDTNVGNSVTGGLVYRGSRLTALRGCYVYGDHVSGNLWALRYDGNTVSGPWWLAKDAGVAAFGRDPRNGDLWIVDVSERAIKRLDPAGSSDPPTLPATLAGTGAFSDLGTLDVHPGILSYDVHTPFWSDGAIKQRWFSIPGINPLIRVPPQGPWQFPTGSVWIKHFELVTNELTLERRRLETRFLIMGDAGVHGLTYRWAPGATNADLMAEGGGTELISILEASGSVRTQAWVYPSRGDCLVCHSDVAGGVLGFTSAQLRDVASRGAASGEDAIRVLKEFGYTSRVTSGPALFMHGGALGDESLSLEYRVRSYLNANCASCHQPGGSAPATWDARLSTPTGEAGLLDGELADTLGDVGNRVLRLGDIDHSMALQRISTRGPGQMPPLGSTRVDAQAVDLLQRWLLSSELKVGHSFERWKDFWFGGSSEWDASGPADPDGDSLSNQDEFLAGTDPLNPADAIRPSLELMEGELILRVRLPANRRLVLLRKDGGLDDSGGWASVELPFATATYPATPTEVVLTLNSIGSPSGYYRVQVSSP